MGLKCGFALLTHPPCKKGWGLTTAGVAAVMQLLMLDDGRGVMVSTKVG